MGAPTIDPWLREIIRCPACLSVLEDGVDPAGAPELRCTGEACGRAYRFDGGVPVLLIDEARLTHD